MATVQDPDTGRLVLTRRVAVAQAQSGNPATGNPSHQATTKTFG
jgi:hypothetical protein